MWRELKSIVKRVSASPEVRVVVLTSALERYFTAGLDCKPSCLDCFSCSSFGLIPVTAQTAFTDESNLDPARKAFAVRQHILVRFLACSPARMALIST